MLKYRPEIDGLRTIAVLSVMVYHLKIPTSTSTLLSGGFLGVDLFFVISGFLITSIIQTEINRTGTFSFLKFYNRRARRILPPLIFVMLASIPFGWFILDPEPLVHYGFSLVSALAFISNFFWYFALGTYGGPTGLVEPFLHTWSLSIEEQFYLLFPVILLLSYYIRKKVSLIAILLLMIAISFLIAVATTHIDKDFSFYSPASRSWELLAGSLVACIYRSRPLVIRNKNRYITYVPTICIIVIFLLMVLVSFEGGGHPGFITVPIIVATCLFILLSNPADPATRVLTLGPIVWVGKISYSLYLVHYPVFAFGRLVAVDSPTVIEYFIWLVVTFIVSIFCYYIIEKPFRFLVSGRMFYKLLVFSSLLIASAAFSFWILDGYEPRLERISEIYGAASLDNDALADASWSILDELSEDEVILGWNAGRPSVNEVSNLWFEDESKQNVLIIGNSHSKDLFNALYLNADLFSSHEFARFGLRTNFPEYQLELLEQSPNFKAAHVIVIASKYNDAAEENLSSVIFRLRQSGKRLILAGNTAQFDTSDPYPVFDSFVRRNGSLVNLNKYAYTVRNISISLRNHRLKSIADGMSIEYFNREELVCIDQEESCILITEDGSKTLYDYGHWTLEGAKLFGQRAAENNWFASDGSL